LPHSKVRFHDREAMTSAGLARTRKTGKGSSVQDGYPDHRPGRNQRKKHFVEAEANADRIADDALETTPASGATDPSSMPPASAQTAWQQADATERVLHPPPIVQTGINLGAAPPPPDLDPNAPPAPEAGPPPPPRKLTPEERKVEALNLRMAGHDYRTIAKELGVSIKTAYFDVQRTVVYLAQHERVLAENVRALELARLDSMQAYLWPAIARGDTFAIGAQLKLMERRAKMLGLDAPTVVEMNLHRPLRECTFEELMDLAQQLRRVSQLQTKQANEIIDAETGKPILDAAYDEDAPPDQRPVTRLLELGPGIATTHPAVTRVGNGRNGRNGKH